MSTEIERKFLIEDISKIPLNLDNYDIIKIKQGYLSSPINTNTVRVRISVPCSKMFGERSPVAFLTVKGPKNGISNKEFEVDFSAKDAMEMMELCGDAIIQKTRYKIPYYDKIIELDVFKGELEGLVIAEVELKSEDDHFIIPSWFNDEISQDNLYSNASLAFRGRP